MIENFNYGELKKKIEEDIKGNKLDISEIEELVKNYKRVGLDIQKLIEYALKFAEGEKKDKLEKIHETISQQNISYLCDKLRGYGYGLRNSKVYERFYDPNKNTPRGIVYRILELTRLGKREEIFHMILREITTAKEEVSRDLVEAFDPKYSLESFKTLIYSFLSGLLGPSSNSKEEGENE